MLNAKTASKLSSGSCFTPSKAVGLAGTPMHAPGSGAADDRSQLQDRSARRHCCSDEVIARLDGDERAFCHERDRADLKRRPNALLTPVALTLRVTRRPASGKDRDATPGLGVRPFRVPAGRAHGHRDQQRNVRLSPPSRASVRTGDPGRGASRRAAKTICSQGLGLSEATISVRAARSDTAGLARSVSVLSSGAR
jgi:hypothetical protein